MATEYFTFSILRYQIFDLMEE